MSSVKTSAQRVYRVGLTGGIASGKSTVAKFFGALGVPIIDTDQVAREVVEPGQPPLERLVERFGQAILTPDGHLDRPKLREIVFSDPKARADLEALTHPAIGTAVQAWSAAAGGPYQILIIPLLVEKNLASHFDRVLVVDCGEELQIRRLQARDGSTVEQARAILNAQTSRAARLKVAHDVIQNEGDLSAVRDQVSALHARYLELAGHSGAGGASITAKAARARS
ncbi:MAG TPA: dephospho-CoA kinase [Steroidobacteraceae bacterium]|nr:dephospho-CoA kinase [Steroidobacteraceae bacterium]